VQWHRVFRPQMFAYDHQFGGCIANQCEGDLVETTLGLIVGADWTFLLRSKEIARLRCDWRGWSSNGD
jgi:hypothetical protein